MRRFTGALWLHLGRMLRQWSVLACLLLAVLITLVLGIFLPADSDGDSMRVGVYMPADSRYGQEIWAALQTYSEGQNSFVLAESPQQVEEMVAARVWECGFVFREEMDERLEQGDYKRLITRVVAPASVPLFSGWTLSAALLEVCAPDIAADFLDETGLPSQGEDIEALAQDYFGVESTMELEVRQIQGGTQVETGSVTGTMLTRGLVALLLFVVCCLGAVRHAGDMESGFFIRLAPYTGPAVLFFSSYVALGLLCAAAGLLCLGPEGIFFGFGYGGFGYQAAVLLLYLVYLGAVSFLLAAVFKKGDEVLFLMPILIIACLLLSPIFFDVGQLVPQLRPVTMLLPTTLYLRGAAGTLSALWQMPLGTAACVGAGALALRLRRG